MVFELKFADIGEGIHEGEILKWHVKAGDEVTPEQLIVEIMTEKVNVEITTPVGGKIVSLGKNEGEIITVGEVLISIDESGSNTIEYSEAKSKKEEKIVSGASEKDDPSLTTETSFKNVELKQKGHRTIVNNNPLASPAIRKKARELGIDLRSIQGTGPGGRISDQDLANYSSQVENKQKTIIPTSIKSFTLGKEDRFPVKGLRRAIAQHMRLSKDHAAHFTHIDEVDMSALDQLRAETKTIADQKGIHLTYLSLTIKAVIGALKKYPILNSSLDEENQEIVIKKYYNIGIAVSTEDGLIVPVIKSADSKDIWQIASEIHDLSKKARENKLKLEDMQGSTFTITSVGNIGGQIATPIINYPEVAILGIMKSKLKPVVINSHGKNDIAIRPIMNVCLSLDHRVVDGAVGAFFVNELIKYLENPALIFVDT